MSAIFSEIARIIGACAFISFALAAIIACHMDFGKTDAGAYKILGCFAVAALFLWVAK